MVSQFSVIENPSLMNIKKAQLDDVPTLFEIEHEISTMGWSIQNFKDALQFYEVWLISTQDEPADVVGFVILQTILDELHLLNIVVSLKHQGQGWGKALLEYAISQAQKKNCSVIYLELRSSNKVARNLYRQYGFAQTGTRKGYYPCTDGTREDARLMMLMIS